MTVQTSSLGVLDAVWTSLRAGLWTVAQTINAEMTAMGRPYALTQPSSVRVVSQVPQPPDITLPAVVVWFVDDPEKGSPHTPSYERRDLLCTVEVAIYDSGAAGAIGSGAGAIGYDAEAISYDAEHEAEMKLRAWAEAVRRCLTRTYAQGGVHGTAGILRVTKTARRREIFLQADQIITASAEILTFTIECKAS